MIMLLELLASNDTKRGRGGPLLEPHRLQPGRQTTNSQLSQQVSSLRTGKEKSVVIAGQGS